MMWSFQGRESKKCVWMVFWGGQHTTPLDGLCEALGIPGRACVSVVLRRKDRTQHSSLGTWMTVPKGSGGKTALLPKSQLGCRCGEGTDGRSPRAELSGPSSGPWFCSGGSPVIPLG